MENLFIWFSQGTPEESREKFPGLATLLDTGTKVSHLNPRGDQAETYDIIKNESSSG